MFLVPFFLGAGCTPASDEDWEPEPPACDDGALADCGVRSLDVDGQTRSYLIVGDDACAGPRPLILAWHGSGTNAEYLRRRSAPTHVGEEPALVVYPQGLPRPELDDRTGWNRDPTGNDIAFFDALVAHLAAESCADADRVYSLGHSRGARFSDVLGCFRGDEHRAIATVSAGTGNVSSCEDRVPMWITHGREDEYVAFWEGEDRRDYWARNNGCEEPGWFSSFDDDQCTELVGCDVDAPVVWCPHTSRDDAGHGPPPFTDEEVSRFFGRF
jgi:poly(3-hydroxybutyrate) depolymerase